MIINAIYISGFKNYKEPKKYEFYDFTEIEGNNAKGKTSIGEAITWGLYGCDLLGDTKSDTKLMNRDSDTMFVIIDYDYEGMRNRIVRKKGKSLTLKLNDERISEKELSKHLPNKDLFLAVFNSKIFLSLPIPKKRELLFRMLPTIEPNDIIKKYNCEDMNELLEKYPDINAGIKEVSTFIKNKKDLLNSKNAEIGLLQKLILENTSNFEIKEEFTSNDEEQLKELQYKLVNSDCKLELISTNEIKSKICEVNSLITVEMNKTYTSLSNDAINDLTLSLATLSGEYKSLTNNYNKINSLDAVCSLCGQAISEGHKQKELNLLTTNLNNIKSEMDGLTESISLITKLEDENKKYFNASKTNVLNKLKEEITSLKTELANIEESNKLMQEVSLNNNSSAIEMKINNLRQKQLDYLKYKSQLNTQQDNEKNYKNKSKSIHQEIIKITEDKISLEIQYNRLKNYNSLYIQYIGEILSSWLDRVSINLFSTVNSTGEIKDTFELKYDTKPLGLISKSEYVKVGLELSNMFNKALNFNLPIFLDDAESILDIPKLQTQMIVSRVKNCEITVTSSHESDHYNSSETESINNHSNTEKEFVLDNVIDINVSNDINTTENDNYEFIEGEQLAFN